MPLNPTHCSFKRNKPNKPSSSGEREGVEPRTHHQVPDDHDQHEDQDAERLARHLHAVPHGLDPLSTQNPEDNQEGMEEILHVPARENTVLRDLTHTVLERRREGRREGR